MLILQFVELLIMENINTRWIKKLRVEKRNKKIAG